MTRSMAESPTPVKICGISRPEDAAAAVLLGARYLGVIFAGGPRVVDEARARVIVTAAGPVPVLGVFGSVGRDEILGVRDRVGLSGAQLHGDHSPELIQELTREGLLMLPVVRLSSAADLEGLDQLKGLGCPLLVEPRVEGTLGGAGVRLPQALALEARERLAGCTMFLAGGLTPETVADTVRAVRPDAVDVSSGVEQIPGIKDHHRMTRFMEALGWA